MIQHKIELTNQVRSYRGLAALELCFFNIITVSFGKWMLSFDEFFFIIFSDLSEEEDEGQDWVWLWKIISLAIYYPTILNMTLNSN